MPFPIFVLEGPDNGGKSTMAKAFHDVCGATIIHSTYRFKGKMGAYHLAQFRKALKHARHGPVVMDRWWPSEVAYGNTFRDGCEYADILPVLQEMAKAYYVSYTFCMPTRWEEYWRWCNKVWNAEEEMYEPDEAKYHWLWMNYRELMLNQYPYYPQNLVQHFNVTLEGNRDPYCHKFVRYCIARMLGQLRIIGEDEKELMRSMTEHYRWVGRTDNLPSPTKEKELDNRDDSELASSHSEDNQEGQARQGYDGATQQQLPL